LKDLKQRTIRGGAAKLGGQVLNFALRLASLVIMARLLDPADFGLVAMVTAVTGLYGLFSTAGFSAATIQTPTITNEQLSTLFWINIIVGALLALLCLATAPILARFYNEPRLFSVTVTVAIGFIISATAVQHSALLQRQLRYVALTICETLSQLAGFAVGTAMAVAGFGYWALVASLIAQPAVFAVCVWAATRWVPGPPRRDAEIGSMLRFGGTLTLNGVVIYVAYNLEKVLLGRFWGADALGLYGRAYQLINIPTENLNWAIGGVVFSALSRVQTDKDRYKNYFIKGYSLVNSLTIPFTMFCAAFANEIVLVALGPKWTDATSIFRLLCPTVLIFGIINPLGWLLQSIGLQTRSLAIALVIAPLVITAYVIGLPYGPNGVAFAYSAALTLWLVPHVIWCLHGTAISPWDLLPAISRPFVSGLVAAFFAFAPKLYFGEFATPLLRLAIGGGIMALLYVPMQLFVMGQGSLYLDLLRTLRGSSSLETRVSGEPSNP
jgi:O-antigen/teichoic acid export membrane protein